MEPPSVGSTTDEHGHSKPVSIYTDTVRHGITVHGTVQMPVNLVIAP